MQEILVFICFINFYFQIKVIKKGKEGERERGSEEHYLQIARLLESQFTSSLILFEIVRGFITKT